MAVADARLGCKQEEKSGDLSALPHALLMRQVAVAITIALTVQRTVALPRSIARALPLVAPIPVTLSITIAAIAAFPVSLSLSLAVPVPIAREGGRQRRRDGLGRVAPAPAVGAAGVVRGGGGVRLGAGNVAAREGP